MEWWIVGLVEFLWVAGVAIWVATDRRAPASTLAWIVVLALLPLIGLPVYLLVGPRRLRRKQQRYQGLSEQRHPLRRVVRREAVPGPAAQARAARAAHRAPVEDHVVAGRDVGDVGSDRLHDAGGLVAEQERELVV